MGLDNDIVSKFVVKNYHYVLRTADCISCGAAAVDSPGRKARVKLKYLTKGPEGRQILSALRALTFGTQRNPDLAVGAINGRLLEPARQHLATLSDWANDAVMAKVIFSLVAMATSYFVAMIASNSALSFGRILS